MVFSCWLCHPKPRKLSSVEEHTEHRLGHLKKFSLQELQVATDCFSNENILGGGGFGPFGKVYKGILEDGSLVAIKRLKSEQTPGGELQFHEVMEMVSMSAHQNLLKLHGLCITRTERLLVYPYMVNGSVASHLRDRPSAQPSLDWSTRKRIALGSAKGLSYLHEQCNPKIVHCDIKAANIFLGEDFEAFLGDFALARLIDCKDTYITCAVRGTIGYIPPEYLSNGRCSEKNDVYGYGVMLLELISGQKAFDLSRLSNDEDIMLLDLVKRLVKENKLEMLVDPDLKNNYLEAEMKQMIQIALFCTQGSHEFRPKMSEVMRMVESVGLAEKWEEWQKMEISGQELGQSLTPTFATIMDTIQNLRADELSGPR